MQQSPGIPQPPPAPPQEAAMRLELKRSELRGQLQELTSRRNQLQAQRSGVSSAKGAELDARIAAIDARTAAVEAQLFATNDQIARGLGDATPVVQTSTEQAVRNARDAAREAARNSSRGAAYSIVSVVALYMIWRAARTAFGRRRAVTSLPDNSAQLTQLQQSLDVIALEVERISEAQRYQAKLMSERGIGAGEAQPIAAPQREPSGVKNSR
jgi:hypothetical protein